MLCEPVLNTGLLPILSSSQLEQGHLILHHVQADSDLPLIFDLLKSETAQNWEYQQLLDGFRDSFAYIAGSHTSQAFMVMLDDLSIFEIEAHEARKHEELHAGFVPLEGDYYITLFTGELDKADLSVYVLGLKLCLDYFFSFPEVRRIIAPLFIGKDRALRAKLLEEAGIRPFLPKSLPKEPDLLIITRPL